MGMLFPVLFTLVPLFIAGVAMALIGTFAFRTFQGIARWQDNNLQPILTVQARVATKRLQVSGGGNDTSASTWYYITFETLADGLRQEFVVGTADYSGLVEGDIGDLTYQGTRYKGFARTRQPASPPPPPPAVDWTCSYCRGRVPAAESKCPACGATQRLETENSG